MNSNDNKKDDISKCKLARFGNKKVIKYSDEYHHQRLKNNESVKNSRLKAKQKQKETESRMNKLAEENRTLNERVDSLMKEFENIENGTAVIDQNFMILLIVVVAKINLLFSKITTQILFGHIL